MTFPKKLLFFICSSCVILFNASFAFALEITYPTILGKSLNDSSSIGDLACYIFSTGIAAAISIAIAVIAFGGIYYLISYGRGKFTSEAKEWIKSGILGLLIVLCSSLIIYTINPIIGSCKLSFLPQFNVNFTGNNYASVPPGVTVSTYQEIPIGVLTENLLTRALPCPDFDQNGDLMSYNQNEKGGGVAANNKDIANVDRVTCFRELIEASEKKAQAAISLSDQLTRLMNTCSCRIKDAYGNDTGQSKCDPVCDPAKGCKVKGSCPDGQCGGDCIGGACKQPQNTTDCCPTGVKNEIEHGGVFVHITNEDLNGDAANSNGSCETGCSSDSQCGIPGQTCDPATHTCGKLYKGLDEFRCDPGTQQCSDISKIVFKSAGTEGGQKVNTIDREKWNSLTLWQQLKWFQEYIAAFRKNYGFESDLNNLQSARTTLSKCYLVTPYVDLVETYKTADQQKNIIVTKPTTLTDFITKQPVDSSKYCTGFNYANSNCLKQCDEACPDTSSQAIQAYSSCSGDESCIEDAYNSRPCPNSPSDSSGGGGGNFDNFGDCMSSCQSDCQGYCGQEYLACSPEYNFCISQCKNDGQCVLDHAGSCLFGAQQFTDCATQSATSDQGNTDYCIKNAYTCKNGSDEYAGYTDCVNASSINPNCSSFTDQKSCEDSNGCSWDGQACAQDHTASFLYQNPNQQKCTDAYSPASSGDCQSSSDSTASCQNVCPETSKCPTASDCPLCPCDQIDKKDLTFSVPNTSTAVTKNQCSNNSECFADQACVNNLCVSSGRLNTPCRTNADCTPEQEVCSSPTNGVCISNAGFEGYKTDAPQISVYQMVGAQCDQYAYNSDPLTFYCEDDWWNDPLKEGSVPPTPIGKERVCNKENDVPVGQTVDNAINWVNNFLKTGDVVNTDIQKILDQMTKMGNAKDISPVKDYCKCDAQLENNDPICATNCQYSQQQINEPVCGDTAPPASAGSQCQCADGTYDSSCCTGSECDCGNGSASDACCTPPTNQQCNCGDGTYSASCCSSGQCSCGDGTYNPACCDGSNTRYFNKSPKFIFADSTNKKANTFILADDNASPCSAVGQTEVGQTQVYQCSCNLVPCKGSPCQQMIDYHSELWNDYKQFKTDFISFDIGIIKGPRSDIIKELAYSRKASNSCSLTNNVYGSEDRLLSCSRVEDELIPPINNGKINFANKDWPGYCYGQKLGKVSGQDLTDDWFCCQEWTTDPTINNNPIYNIHNNNF